MDGLTFSQAFKIGYLNNLFGNGQEKFNYKIKCIGHPPHKQCDSLKWDATLFSQKCFDSNLLSLRAWLLTFLQLFMLRTHARTAPMGKDIWQGYIVNVLGATAAHTIPARVTTSFFAINTLHTCTLHKPMFSLLEQNGNKEHLSFRKYENMTPFGLAHTFYVVFCQLFTNMEFIIPWSFVAEKFSTF